LRLIQGLLVLLSVSAMAEADGLRTTLDRADDLVRAGHATDALQLLERAVIVHPDALSVHLRYQDLSFALGRGPKLRRTYSGRARAQPKSGEASYLHARLVDGRRAITLYRRTLKMAPALVPAWADYARLLLDEGRPKEALRAAERAVELGPKVAGAHEAHGWVLENAGNDAPAEAAYRRALVFDPHDLHARIKLAQLLARGGRKKQALVELAFVQKR